MLFHTWTFAIFFSIFYVGYLYIRHTRWKIPWLVAASYVFYGWWNPLFLILIAWATTVDWTAVTLMERYPARKRLWLTFSLVNDLGLLGFFKYAGFVTNNINALLTALGAPYQLPVPDITLPVGISFFTFQSMSYTIDYYRGYIEREPSLLRYAAYVSIFPQLVAGPIERAAHLLPQIRGNPPIRFTDFTDGLSLFAVGLFKKVAMADYLGAYVDQIYASPADYSGLTLAAATFAFGWQIYFDFAGYTDMARGVARMMGLRLMLNFNNPYLATGLGDFWRRWHISLSSWFKDYVYIPLGGNRRGKFNTYRNMFLTMVISGLWHGAAWTFVAWGALHALGRFVTRELERTKFYAERVPRIVKQIWVVAFVMFTWVFFRAQTWADAKLIAARILTDGVSDPRFPYLAAGLIASIWLYQYLYESPLRRLLELRVVKVLLVLAMLIYLSICAQGAEQPFIYFQF